LHDALPILPNDRNQLMLMISQMQQLLASGGGAPVNWQVAHDLARQSAHAGGDPTVTAAEADRLRQALSVADPSPDAVTDLAPAGGPQAAWSCGELLDSARS